ncbi:MAG: hypothetical protein N3C12_04600 [Candidatus Binatia bacterium]|nr:hypothetical protein [Candidatus Binatia bacterium]
MPEMKGSASSKRLSPAPNASRSRRVTIAESRVSLLLALCLAFSGAASLALEVVWMRELRLAFGSTTLASSTVLVAYMLGLGTGAWLGGNIANRSSRALQVYAALEIIVGLYALAVPWLSRQGAATMGGWLVDTNFWLAAATRFAASQLIFLVPTVAMGATLPVAVSAAGGPGGVGRTTALLYAANTAGAVAGVFAATFYLLPRFGLVGANTVAALTDLLLGVAVLLWERATRPAAAPVTSDPGVQFAAKAAPAQLPARLWPLLAVYAGIGFVALAHEVCWTRALAAVFGSSSYAFGTMLGTFLLGIALGSWAMRRRADTLRSPGYVAAVLVVALSVASLATFKILFWLPAWFPWAFVYLGGTYEAAMTSTVFLALVAMLPPTTILGSLFPLLVALIARTGQSAGWSVSQAYVWNTVGSALGAFAGGFLLLPAVGLQNALSLLSSLTAAFAGVLAVWQRDHVGRRRAAVIVAAALLVAGIWLAGPRVKPEELTRGVYRFPLAEIDVGVAPVALRGPLEGELLFYHDGWNATVSVHRILGELSLRVNGKADASTRGDLPTQVLLGHLGYFFRPAAQNVAIVGLASGITAGSATLYGARRIDVIEIEPAMVAASRWFDHVNLRPLEHPAVRLIVDDARAFLAGKREAYDLILSEPSNPWMAGPANLFTREFFHQAGRALRPHGLLVQWLQLYAMPPEAVAAVLQALLETFPHVYGFAPGHGETDLLLVASRQPIEPTAFPSWESLPTGARRDLVRAGVFDEADVRALLYLTPGAIRALAARAPKVNSDDNMFVELTAPRALYADPTGPENWEAIDAHASELAEFWLRSLPEADSSAMAELALAYLRREAAAQAEALVQREQQGRGKELARAVRAQLDFEQQEASAAALDRLVTELRQVVSAFPDSYAMRYLLAQAEYDSQNHTRALSQVDKGLQRRPEDLRLRRLRLRILLALGWANEAWKEAQELLPSPLKERDIELYWDAAQAAAASGQVNEAIRLTEIYLDYHPDSPEQWSFLAAQYNASGQPQAAARARSNAEQAKRNTILSLHMQARRTALAGDQTGALALLRNVLLFDPSYTRARHDLEALERGDALSW